MSSNGKMGAWAVASDPHESIRRNARVGNALVLILICGCGGWAATTEIAGAVVAAGSLVVESNVKKVQHPTGGVVSEILARTGDRVKAGDVLVRLDQTLADANLAIVKKVHMNSSLARRVLRPSATAPRRLGFRPNSQTTEARTQQRL